MALVVLSLVPYLALSVAVLPLRHIVIRGVGLTPTSFDLAFALSTGAYAAGTVLALQLAVTLWICAAVAAAGLLGGGAVYLSGRPPLEAPDLERWQGEGDDAAWATPALGAALPRRSA